MADLDNGISAARGPWAFRVGGPLAILAAVFSGVFYLGYQDRQATLRTTKEIVSDQHGQIRDEMRLLRCLVSIRVATGQPALATDEQVRIHCRWLWTGPHEHP